MSSIRLGTRGSPLALRQTDIAMRQLCAAGIDAMETVIITTTGDMVLDKPLYDIGGKGLFAKELQQALMDKAIDVAVHSLKDMEWQSPKGLQLTAVLERHDPRDCFISFQHTSYQDLPQNAVIGTCAPRRMSQLKHRLPNIMTIPLRGNIQTRLHLLDEMKLDGIVLAVAGMERLGLSRMITSYFESDFMIPAAGQGVIALETRADDHRTNEILQQINHQPTWDCIIQERSVIAQVNGNCHTAIGVYAQQLDNATLTMDAALELNGQLRFANAQGDKSSELANQIVRSLLT